MVRFAFYSAFVNGAAFDVGDQLAKVEEALGAGADAFALAGRKPAWTGRAPPSALDASPAAARPRKAGRVAFDRVEFASGLGVARPEYSRASRAAASSA